MDSKHRPETQDGTPSDAKDDLGSSAIGAKRNRLGGMGIVGETEPAGGKLTKAERKAIHRKFIEGEAAEEDEEGRVIIGGDAADDDDDADDEGNIEGLVAEGDSDDASSDADSSSQDSGSDDGSGTEDGSPGSGRGKKKRRRLQKRRVQVDDDDRLLIAENQGLAPSKDVASELHSNADSPFSRKMGNSLDTDPQMGTTDASDPLKPLSTTFGEPPIGDEIDDGLDSDASDDFIALSSGQRKAQRVQRRRARAMARASGVSLDDVQLYEEVFGSRGAALLAQGGAGEEDSTDVTGLGGDAALLAAFGEDLARDAEAAGEDVSHALELDVRTGGDDDDEAGLAGEQDGAGMTAAAKAAFFLTPTDARAKRANGPERLYFWQGRREAMLRPVVELAKESPKSDDWLVGRDTKESAVELLANPQLPGATTSAASILTEAQWVSSRLFGVLTRELEHERKIVSTGSFAAATAANNRVGELEKAFSAGSGTIVRESLLNFSRRILWWVLRVKLEPVFIWLTHREAMPSFVRLRHVWCVLDLDAEWCAARARRAVLLRRLQDGVTAGMLDIPTACDIARQLQDAVDSNPSRLDPCNGTGGVEISDACQYADLILRGSSAAVAGLGGAPAGSSLDG